MKSDEVSRRFVVGALGVGAAAAAATAATGVAVGAIQHPRAAAVPQPQHGSPGPGSSEPETANVDPAVQQADRLVAPLAPGHRLGRWTVQQILPVQNGAASVVLADASGEHFQLDICARDPSASAQKGPGRSERFEIFLANSGNGSKATFEDHGLAAMALAEVIRANEHHVDHALFKTQARRTSTARVFIT